jgi:hypothetical protein
MKLLYVMNDDPAEMHALEDIVSQARKCRAHLLLLDIVDTLPTFDVSRHTKQLPYQLKNTLLRERLARLESFVLTNGIDAEKLRARVLFGNRAQEIVRSAAEGSIDLIIKQREPGATDRALEQHSPCPVLLFEPDTRPTADTIVEALPQPQRKQAVA